MDNKKAKNFKDWQLQETKHVIDMSGFKPSVWEDRRVTRNIDGKEGRIGKPIGDSNKGATKYRIVFDDGTDDILSLSSIKKHYDFFQDN